MRRAGRAAASASRHTRKSAASTAPAPATSPHWPDQAGERQVGLPLGQVLRAQEAQGVVGPAEQRPPTPPRCAPAGPPSPSRSGTRARRPGSCRAARPGRAAGQTDSQRRRDRGRRDERQQEARRDPADAAASTPARTASRVDVLRSGWASGQPDRQRPRAARPATKRCQSRPGRAEHGGEDQEQAELGQLRGLEAERARWRSSGWPRSPTHPPRARRRAARRSRRRRAQPRTPSSRTRTRQNTVEGEQPAARDHGLPDRQLGRAGEGQVRQPEPDQRRARPPRRAGRRPRCGGCGAPARSVGACAAGAREGGTAGPVIDISDPSRQLARAGAQEPRRTGGPAATAGCSVTALTATPPVRRQKNGVHDSDLLRPGRHRDRSSGCRVRGARAAVRQLEPPAHSSRVGSRDESQAARARCTGCLACRR